MEHRLQVPLYHFGSMSRFGHQPNSCLQGFIGYCVIIDRDTIIHRFTVGERQIKDKSLSYLDAIGSFVYDANGAAEVPFR